MSLVLVGKRLASKLQTHIRSVCLVFAKTTFRIGFFLHEKKPSYYSRRQRVCKEGEVKLVLAYIAVWFGSGLVPAAGLTPHFTTAPHASPDYILSVFPGCTELSWSCAVNGQIDAHTAVLPPY